MSEIPEEAVQAAAPDLYEVIWFAAFGHLEQVQAGVRASDLRATVLGIIKAINTSGLVVVSAEDLRSAVEVLASVNDPWRHISEEPELEARLRAALPERSTDGR